jgi:hypothetical protein
MALEAISLENTDFSDIPRSNARYYNVDHPAPDPISYAFDGPKGLTLITNADRFVCLTGLHLAKPSNSNKIEATRTVSPGFTALPKQILDSFVEFHDTTVEPYRQSGISSAFDQHVDRLVQSGATLPGGVAGKLVEGRVEFGMFFALNVLKMGIEAARTEIAHRSFTPIELLGASEVTLTIAPNEVQPVADNVVSLPVAA